MKIVIAGRFDYVEIIWRELAKEGKLIYFENDVFRKFTVKDRLRRRCTQLLHKVGIISDGRYAEELQLDNYRELFDLDCLKRTDEILFMLYEMNVLSTDFKTIEILKKRYPNAKFVLYFTNIIGSVRNESSAAILKNKDLYDKIYTYSLKDAEKYNFEYLVYEPYYRIYPETDERYYSDVLWLGRNKGRYEELVKIHDKLKSQGLNVKIMVVDEELPEQKEPIEILNKGLSYAEYIKYVIGTKCLLEIEEHGALTMRFTEAVAYGKLLLTNCTEKVNSDEMKEIDQIIRFHNIDDLDNLDLSYEDRKFIDPDAVSAEGFLKRIKNDLANVTQKNNDK